MIETEIKSAQSDPFSQLELLLACKDSYKRLTLKEPRIQPRVIKVFDHESLIKLAETKDALSSESGDQQRLKATLLHLLENDEHRPLAMPGPAWEGEVEELAHAFPAFARVIAEVVSPSLAVLAARGIVRPPPVLLVGAPGIGKTFFLSALARVLGVPLVKQDMSSTTTGASLSGLGVHWSNSSPGCVFKTLAFGRPGWPPVANPLLLLDELDKAGGDPRFDTFGPMHALLEEESAATFEDESLPGVVINASQIRWMCTANSTKTIPSPILSRLHVIEITEPTRAEKIALSIRIFERAVESMELYDFDDELPKSMHDRAADLAPREFKRLAQMAIGNALARNRLAVKDVDFITSHSTAVWKMGF